MPTLFHVRLAAASAFCIALFIGAGAAAQGNDGGWSARVEGGRLIVSGVVSAPNPGYEAYLRPIESSDPSQLSFQVELRQRPGIWPQVIEEKTVSYVVPFYLERTTSIVVRDAYDGTHTVRVRREP